MEVIIRLFVFLIIPLYLFAINGKVVKITDGDTLTILTDINEQIKIRLHGIDAPEKKQAFGEASRKNLADLCANKTAIIEDKGQDRYKRTLGIVYCDSVNANEKQVQDGYAWAYTQYSKDYIKYEKEAKEAKKGLWQDKSPIAPYNYRKSKKGGT
jgi:endonuclease YncB( thermonuclease family)